MRDDLVFIPGEDFDPYDEDDVAAVKAAMDNDMALRARYGDRRDG